MQGVLSSGGLVEGLVMRAPCFMQAMMVGGGGGGRADHVVSRVVGGVVHLWCG